MRTVLESLRWWLVLIVASLFLLWVLLRTYSSENVIVDDGPDAETVQTETENDQFQTPLSEATQSEDQANTADETELSEIDISTTEIGVTLGGEWGEADISTVNADDMQKVYIFTHEDESQLRITIGLRPIERAPSDYSWPHVLSQDGNLFSVSDVDDSGTALCDPVDTLCSAGNGLLDISSLASTDADTPLYVLVEIAETQQELDEARSVYRTIIESITIST